MVGPRRMGIGILALALLMGCAKSGIEQAPRSNAASMANPASVNCGKKGGRLTIQRQSDGGEIGICTFADGTICEEWVLYRGECRAL